MHDHRGKMIGWVTYHVSKSGYTKLKIGILQICA